MTLPHDLNGLQSKMSGAVRAHWKAFLIEGIVLVVLGLAAILVPPIAGIAITVMLGWMFLISGAAGLATGARGGVVVDDGCRTEDPRVWAVGEVATRDFLRSELRSLLAEIDDRREDRRDEQQGAGPGDDPDDGARRRG